ncbi:hypothetical protein PR048_028311 [Dryococelus australis]|uniref:XPG-I domain-containing protein n=1 Tax=Dryococelus australis TaxID=614101 RepID=A0ABQ9GIS8_9NEOP|nr:hypothetical protein PR048_028311 [Dryococelus australis]
MVLRADVGKEYTCPSTIQKDLSSEKKSEDPDLGTERRLRSSVDLFNRKQDSLYCGEEASIRKETKKEVKFRKTICEVTTLLFKDSAIARALERWDAWVEIVHAPAVSVADLVADEAKYHKQWRLLFVSTVEECKRHNQGSCIVTFDQPVYAKASEIIAAAPPGELDSVTLLLGGFHLLVSFMGSIGFIIAVLAHMLTSQSLITMILGMENLFGVYQEELHKLFLEVSTGEKMIPDAVESPVLELSGIKAVSFEQHVELRDSRRIRDPRDVAVLLSWLKEHSTWDVDCLRSLARGVVADDSINCDQAQYVCLGAIKLIIGSTLGEVKLTQKNRVKPLSAVARSILIRDDVVEVNSHQLFMRIVYVMKTENDLKHYLSYELSPRPPALFDEVAMTSAEIMFDMNTSASTTQADFLSNHHNKERLITLLSHHFETSGIEVCNSEGDADTLALELASVGNNVTVVASDTDIAVMLPARATDDMELRVLSSVTGCDTSAFLGKGKEKAWKILQRPDMRNVTKVFNSPESMKEEVCATGEKFVIALYGRINVNSLDELRVIQYTRSIAKQPVADAFELVTLPPTSAACAEHSLRTYYQAHQSCDNISLNQVDWGVETGWRILGSNTD